MPPPFKHTYESHGISTIAKRFLLTINPSRYVLTAERPTQNPLFGDGHPRILAHLVFQEFRFSIFLSAISAHCYTAPRARIPSMTWVSDSPGIKIILGSMLTLRSCGSSTRLWRLASSNLLSPESQSSHDGGTRRWWHQFSSTYRKVTTPLVRASSLLLQMSIRCVWKIR
jgi:hypothetical protein